MLGLIPSLLVSLAMDGTLLTLRHWCIVTSSRQIVPANCAEVSTFSVGHNMPPG